LAQLFLGPKLEQVTAKLPLLLYPFWLLEASILSFFWWVSSLLSPDRATAFGRWLFSRLGPHLPKNRQVRDNLRLAFPEKTPAQIDTLARGVWGNFGAVLAEYPHLGTIAHDPTEQRLEIVAKTDLQPYCQGKKAAVFVSAHLANWELPPVAALKLRIPVTAIYSPLRNPLLNRMLWRKRQALGCGFLTKQDSMRPTIRLLSSGTSMGFIVDQRVDDGEWLPFFGIEALTTSSPARLALRLGCELIPVQVERLQGARFRVTAHPPVKPDDDQADNSTKALQMTNKINALFAAWIRQHPQEWLCTKRRWPKTAAPAGSD
jgi:KDO2-lipid IV(A) lauroyltransferase